MTKRPKINKVLIANRAEIALRIQRACKNLGIATVTIASEADRNALFAREAQELVLIGPPPARESYLAIDKIVQAAKAKGCDAVHPGYGFLSENSDFAQAVIEAGLIFIGPKPESIRVLGSKTEARKRVTEFGVPCTPGSKGDLDDEALLKEAQRIGFPLLIKAQAGGGGRGMRVVESLQEMREVLPRARAEVKKNFSSPAVFIERYIHHPRHVEVQIFGDSHGNVIHLGTRDCSTQRRHQKLVEEAPAPFLKEELREKIHQAAVQAAKSVNYENAGTAEFLVKGEEFYFLEMNTRIQVEHPVTEMVTGIDLVELQLKVAMGERLPFSQKDIQFKAHSIEFRIYAEDPAHSFAPAIGKITKLSRPEGSYIREDHGYVAGDEISPHYDALISKLIITAPARDQAIELSAKALERYEVKGVTSTIDFHKWLLYNGVFRKSGIDIGFVEREFSKQALRAYYASKIRDPKHQKPIGGRTMEGKDTTGSTSGKRRYQYAEARASSNPAVPKNCYQYKSEKFNQTYTIEVLHREDGFFLAVPVDAKGRRAKNKNCRVSNGLDTVVKSIIDDVLETTPPQELFGE